VSQTIQKNPFRKSPPFFFKSILIYRTSALTTCSVLLQKCVRVSVRSCACYILSYLICLNLLRLQRVDNGLATPSLSLTITACGRIVVSELVMMDKAILISFDAALMYGHLPGEPEGNHS